MAANEVDWAAFWAEGDVAALRAAIEREDDFGVYARAPWACDEIVKLRAALTNERAKLHFAGKGLPELVVRMLQREKNAQSFAAYTPTAAEVSQLWLALDFYKRERMCQAARAELIVEGLLPPAPL